MSSHNHNFNHNQKVYKNLDYCSNSKENYANNIIENTQSTRNSVSPYCSSNYIQ